MNPQTEELSAKINLKLENDLRLAPYALKARVYENGIVQIQGIVDVLEEKIQAEELVWNIPGVKKVENNITVCTDGEVDDFDVAFEVSEELQANPSIPATVGVKVTSGEVQLVGTVSNYNEAKEAMDTAAKARGVCEVHSQLKLNEPVDDITLNNSVQEAIIENLGFFPGKIKLQIHQGVVSFIEKLPEKQQEAIVDIITKVHGVKGIELTSK